MATIHIYTYTHSMKQHNLLRENKIIYNKGTWTNTKITFCQKLQIFFIYVFPWKESNHCMTLTLVRQVALQQHITILVTLPMTNWDWQVGEKKQNILEMKNHSFPRPKNNFKCIGSNRHLEDWKSISCQ